ALCWSRPMPDRPEPRWLDRAAAAAYVSMSEAAFCRRVSLGKFPRPNLAAGEQSPRWDRLALDAAFGVGADSGDAGVVFQRVANEIEAERAQGGKDRQANTRRRHGQGIPLRPIQGQAARSSD